MAHVRRGPRLWLGLLLAVMVIPVGAQTATYTSPDGLITIVYPEGWEIYDGFEAGLFELSSPDGRGGVVPAGELQLQVNYLAGNPAFAPNGFAQTDFSNMPEAVREAMAAASAELPSFADTPLPEALTIIMENNDAFLDEVPELRDFGPSVGAIAYLGPIGGQDGGGTVEFLIDSETAGRIYGRGRYGEGALDNYGDVLEDILRQIGGGGAGGGAAPVLADGDCVAFVVASTNAEPLTRVVTTNMPDFEAEFTPTWTDEGGTSFPATLEYLDDGAVNLITPAFPNDPFAGGTLALDLVGPDGAAIGCAPVAVTIAGLQPAPGAYAEAVAEAERTFAALRVSDGIPETFDLPEDAPAPVLLGYAMADAILDSTTNPNSPANIAAGTAPLSAEIDIALLDAIAAQVNLAEALRAVQGDLPPTAMRETLVVSSSDRPPAQSDTGFWRLDITTGGELDAAMRTQVNNDFWSSGPAGAALNDTGLLISSAGVVPGLGGATTAIGTTMYIVRLPVEFKAKLYPKTLTDLDVDSQFFTEEDDPGTRTYSEPRLTAVSDRLPISQLIFDGVLTATGAGAGKVKGGAQGAGAAFEAAAQPGLEIASNLCGRAASCSDNNAFIGPYTWTVPLTPDYYTVAVEGGVIPAVEIIDEQARQYEANFAESSELLFRTRSGFFNGQRLNTRSTVQVPEGVITLSGPRRVKLDPGQTQCYGVSLDNFIDESWDYNATGPLLPTVTQDTLCVTAPPAEPPQWDFFTCDTPTQKTQFYEFQVIAGAITGARAHPNAPMRFDFGIVEVNQEESEPPPPPEECEEEEPEPPVFGVYEVRWSEYTCVDGFVVPAFTASTVLVTGPSDGSTVEINPLLPTQGIGAVTLEQTGVGRYSGYFNNATSDGSIYEMFGLGDAIGQSVLSASANVQVTFFGERGFVGRFTNGAGAQSVACDFSQQTMTGTRTR
ncbi:MAG: hypothetical protein AAF125_04320 [Chloroflexota bacterium]